ncbi:hypothetical protein V6N13_004547 [Hibiscus sabdariffa]
MADVEEELAGLSIGEDEEDLLDLVAEPPQSDLPSDMCFVARVLLENQDVQFGWDISLRALARMGGVRSSGVGLGPVALGQNYDVDMAQLGEDVPLEKLDALK